MPSDNPAVVCETAIDPAWTAAQTAWGEARNQGYRGLWAVLNVIFNRAARPGWWGQDIIGVCQAPEQFSCWNETDPNRAKLLAVTTEDPQFCDALRLAQQMVRGELPDITGGADSYYADSMAPPDWVATARMTEQIGDHRFYYTGS